MAKDSRTNPKSISFSEAVDAFVLDCKARRLSPRTVGFYEEKLGNFTAWAGGEGLATVGEVTPQVIRAFLVHLEEKGHNAGGQHAHARVLRTWFYFLTEEGVWQESPMRRVKMPKMPKPSPVALTVGDVDALINAAETPRDVAIILALLDTGARVSEFVALDVGDVDFDTGAVTIHRGKGGKGRTVYMGYRAMRALRRYLRGRDDMVTHDSPLWASFRFKEEGVRLTTSAVSLMLRRVAKRARVERHNPHAFRATFALWSLRSGMDIYMLAHLMGHEDITTLRHYLAIVQDDLATAHRQHGPVNGFYSSQEGRK